MTYNTGDLGPEKGEGRLHDDCPESEEMACVASYSQVAVGEWLGNPVPEPYRSVGCG